MGKYWIPKYKDELVNWLTAHYLKKGHTVTRPDFKNLKKDVLYAIYNKIRRQENEV